MRRYVNDGFRSGFSLNPLFLESFVSPQLPDSKRVPALYAYLVADAREIDTAPYWSAKEYAQEHPSSVEAFGGPLKHAWDKVQSGEQLTTFASGLPINLTILQKTISRAGGLPSNDAEVVAQAPESRSEKTLFIVQLDENDRDGQVLTITRELCDTLPQTSACIDTSIAPWDVRFAGAILAEVHPDITIAVPPVPGTGTFVLRREPNTVVSIETLLALRHAASLGPVSPLLLASDGTIASAGILTFGARKAHLLAGFPLEDARAIGPAVPSAILSSPVSAVRQSDDAPPRVLTQYLARVHDQMPLPKTVPLHDILVSPPTLARGLKIGGSALSGPIIRDVAEVFELADGTVVPRLRWGIKTAAPAGPRGESWGDTHFARALATALERLGQYAAVDALPAAHRPSSQFDDVSIVLRGPHRIDPPPTSVRILWIISHPDQISATELDNFDTVFAASRKWAEGASRKFDHAISPLLQCTDPSRFRPSGIARDGEIIFVGTARGIHRPAVVGPIRAGIPVRVYGPDWRGYIPSSNIVSLGIANDELAARYESAGVVLNDHWPEMHKHGFISNRLYDVLGSGGRVISDDVPGIDEAFQGAVPTFRDVDELVAMLQGDIESRFPDDDERSRISSLVRERDSFDARARELLEAALRRG